MKSISILFTILILFSMGSLCQNNTNDPCLQPENHEKCYTATKSIFDDLIYLKSRPFSREMSNMKFKLNLKRNTLYLFDICQGVKAKCIITLYDEQENVIASTYNKDDKRFNRALNYYSKSSGNYLISVDFNNSNASCVVVVMGMIRKNIETYVKIAPN